MNNMKKFKHKFTKQQLEDFDAWMEDGNVIKMQDGDVSLNWGTYQGPNGAGGFAITKIDGRLHFSTGKPELYKEVIKYMTSKGMEIPKYAGFREGSKTFMLFTDKYYLWNYDPKVVIDVAKFIATKVSAR